MKVFVLAKANAKVAKIERLDETRFRIAVKEPPKDGRANAAIARALAEYFKVSPASVSLLIGASSKKKVYAIS